MQSGRITIEVAPAGPAGWEARARLVLGARIAELRWVSFDSPENARGFRQVDEGREAACAQIRAEVERAFR